MLASDLSSRQARWSPTQCRRWSSPEAFPPGRCGSAADAVRILVLTHRLPYAPNRGDRIRAFHLLKLLAATHEVHLVSLVHDDEERSHLGELDYLASVRVARVRSRLAGIAA